MGQEIATDGLTRIVNIRLDQEADIYIARPPRNGGRNILGNLNIGFAQGIDRLESIRRYAFDFQREMRTSPEFREAVEKARGKRLGCFCVPQECHGHVIACYHLGGIEAVEKIANGASARDMYSALSEQFIHDKNQMIMVSDNPDNSSAGDDSGP